MSAVRGRKQAIAPGNSGALVVQQGLDLGFGPSEEERRPRFVDEINTARFPISIPSTNCKNAYVDVTRARISIAWVGKHRITGADVPKEWNVQGDPELGLPTDADIEVYNLMVAMTVNQEAISPQVSFTRWDMLKALGRGDGRREYEWLDRALMRLRRVQINACSTYWNKRTKDYVKMRDFSLFQRIDFENELKGRGNKVRESLFEWSSVHFDSIVSGYVKPLDQNIYRNVSPLTRHLYQILDVYGHQRRTFTFRMETIGHRLLLLSDKAPSHLRRRLEGCHEELRDQGYLSDVLYEEDRKQPLASRLTYIYNRPDGENGAANLPDGTDLEVFDDAGVLGDSGGDEPVAAVRRLYVVGNRGGAQGFGRVIELPAEDPVEEAAKDKGSKKAAAAAAGANVAPAASWKTEEAGRFPKDLPDNLSWPTGEPTEAELTLYRNWFLENLVSDALVEQMIAERLDEVRKQFVYWPFQNFEKMKCPNRFIEESIIGPKAPYNPPPRYQEAVALVRQNAQRQKASKAATAAKNERKEQFALEQRRFVEALLSVLDKQDAEVVARIRRHAVGKVKGMPRFSRAVQFARAAGRQFLLLVIEEFCPEQRTRFNGLLDNHDFPAEDLLAEVSQQYELEKLFNAEPAVS